MGVRLEKRKIYILAHADDVVVLAENEDSMRSLMARLEGYLDRKGL